MHDISAYILIGEEITKELNKNRTDIVKLLRKVEPGINCSLVPLSIEGERNRVKDIVPVIIASAAAISAVLISLAKLLDTYFNRPHFYEWEEMELASDSKNKNKFIDKIPEWKIVKKQNVLNAEKNINETNFEISAGIKGITFKINTSKK